MNAVSPRIYHFDQSFNDLGNRAIVIDEDSVSLGLPFQPFEQLRIQLAEELPKPLLHRGEAHLTLISKPEWKRLQLYLQEEAIRELIVHTHLREAKLVVCGVGRAQAAEKGRTLATYYLIVESVELLDFRYMVQEAFIQLGGDPSHFDAEAIYPHVTIGFTDRDLHWEGDGVHKSIHTLIGEVMTAP